MRQKMKTGLSLLLAILLLLSVLTACAKDNSADPNGGGSGSLNRNDIIILYTNDVHCGVDDNIGYAGLAAYRNYCKTITPYTTLVDCGDAIQGGLIGTVSNGEYVVDIMNQVNYDLAILGNHEFDFGMTQLSALMKKSKATYLGCNITYSGTEENALKDLKPYQLIRYGSVSVAFIGVSTPYTLTGSTPRYFQENGEFVYSFDCGGAENFYGCVQGYIDECHEKGADYVVLLTHLGDTDETAPYTSVELIQNTSGADAVLDGHSHSTIPCYPVKDKNGESVLLSSTGTKLNAIGQLTITQSGTLTTTLVSRIDWSDDAVKAYVEQVQEKYEQQMERVIGSSAATLSGYTADGVRLVRSRETTIGNFCADAYRKVTGADIGWANGGGIRADLSAGEITYADLININPFGNQICMVEATGQEIADALEVSYCSVQAQYEENGIAVGENGEFLQISGLKLTIDTSVESSVKFDSNGMMESIGDVRRVGNIMVLNESGEYEPLDLEKTYTVASNNYLLKNGGGNHEIFTDNVFLIDEGMTDYDALLSYVTDLLGGTVGSQYAATEDRITVR